MTSPPTSPHTHPVRVYWEDTDAGGIVYHASHVRFFERGRTEFLRALGVSQSALPDLFFTVRRMEVDYLRPARLDDLLAVETRVQALTGARLTLRQTLVRDGETVADAVVTIVAIGGAGRPKRIPETLLALFAAAVAPPQ
jgi:acyl-CoA thioester hydrolase